MKNLQLRTDVSIVVLLMILFGLALWYVLAHSEIGSQEYAQLASIVRKNPGFAHQIKPYYADGKITGHEFHALFSSIRAADSSSNPASRTLDAALAAVDVAQPSADGAPRSP